MIGLFAAIAGTLAISYAGIKFLLVLEERRLIEFDKHVKTLVSTAGQEIDIARRVFRSDFEDKRTELQELVKWVGQQFGSDLAKNTREIYWLRMLVRTLQDEREWLASLLGSSKDSQEDQAA